MTFTEIQTEVDSLTTEEQDKLAAYLTLLQKERDPEWKDSISKKFRINKRTVGFHWNS